MPHPLPWQRPARSSVALSRRPSAGAYRLSLRFTVDMCGELDTIEAPMLIMRSSNEPLFSMEEAKEMASEIPHASIAVIDHPNHFIASEAQDTTNAVILASL
jgi:pimeloyl-ACP methyl ester carboxylesterase